ncbi:tRNA 2'-O-methylase [archaeon BMS3Abin16]|nr:tRNA 2'-O-methylase [archaeon BMS3Abin16]GBE56471.1 tRNA 2'-O-methylase [archaeon BMS3Bbin16]
MWVVKRENKVFVLRLGHRPFRDKRVTSHVGLVARAFGASGLVISVEDETVSRSIRDVVDRWGGDFSVDAESDWRGYLKRWKGFVVHLTMYGLPLDDVISEVQSVTGDVLVVVGAEKVPPEVYKRADLNVAVGSQPHSEIAALALFLDRLFKGKGLRKDFQGKTRIIPSANGKKALSD